MPNFLEILNKSFGVYKIKGIYVEHTYWQAATIVFLIFLMLFTLARLRFLYVHWNLGKSSLSMLFWGFLLALILEGFLILSGRTILTEILGWKNAPKPISTALDVGRGRLITVLGEQKEVPASLANEKPNASQVLENYNVLSEEDSQKVKQIICMP